MAASKARIRVRNAAPVDARTMAEIDFAAFGEDIIGQLIHPPPVNLKAIANTAAGFFPPPGEKDSSHAETLLVVAELLPEDDPEDGPGEVVAWAKWVLRREPLPEEVWNVEPVMTADMLGEGSNLEMYNWFIAELHRHLRHLVRGDAHLCRYFSSLGSGRFLLKRGRFESSCLCPEPPEVGCWICLGSLGRRTGRQAGS